MVGQGSFFSRDHDRLLNIAAWAKSLAWVVLVVFALWAIADFLGQQYMTNVQFVQFGQPALAFSEMLRQSPTAALRILLSAVGIFFKGIVYYLVLTSMSLGLNMVVETDVNYREKAEAAQ